MNDAKEEVRARLAIEDVIGEYVQLKRAGRYWRGLSPFSNEKTPSFFVTPERDIWHDFSSAKGGDIFSFVMEVEGLDFRGALELLARKAGIDLSQYDERAPKDLSQRKDRILSMNQHALNYFQREMLRSKSAQDYISGKRRLTKETVMKWGIGFAPESPNLKGILLSKKFSEAEIRGAGLIGGRGGEMFRSRMMIPLRDSQGQVVGFTGRIVGDGEPKYLNTPATILYDKGRQVFGLNFAKQAIRKADFTVLVEGNLDVISSHQAGVENVVACAGTAMTRDHLKSLSRLSRNVRLCFDGDRAGVAATERAIGLAETLDVKLSVIVFDSAKDPDELIVKDVALWQAAIDTHVPAVEWVINQYAVSENLETADGKKILTSKSLSLIGNLSDPVEKEFYLKMLSKLTEASIGVLEQKMYSNTKSESSTTSRRILKPTKITRREYNRRDEKYLINNVLAIAMNQQRLRSVLHNLPDIYLTEILAKVKYYLLGEKIEIDSELADKLAELELIIDQELDNVDERLMMLNYLKELESLRLRARFEQLSHELAAALDNNEVERISILNGAVNGIKRDLTVLDKTGSRDDFAGLFSVWDGRKEA